jgi:hypothetical protein
MPAAAAIELVHTYSLIHDDLPAMDDDDLRRGRPTCHRAYDEATAILVGDALQVLAFEILANDPAMTPDPAQRLEVIRLLAHASGTAGMAGGQAVDLEATGQILALEALEDMHRRKTGALIHASVMMAAASADELKPGLRTALDTYGAAIGLALAPAPAPARTYTEEEIARELSENGIAGMPLDFGDALALEAAAQRELGAGHDFAEGVAAFFAKRPAAFKDR